MDKNFAIFDMDGTLVDSMPYWKNLSPEYLSSKGISDIPKDILEKITPMTVKESSRFFVEQFGLDATPETVADEIHAMMGIHYIEDIPIREGVEEYLEKLKARGVKMCVASATVEPLMDACLTRLGVRHYFEFTLSCDTVGAGKNSPLVYLTAAERLGAKPEETAVYEDSCFAAATAKNAGFYLCGVYDPVSDAHWEELKALSHEAIAHW
ncbi:MAG: HAD family phosphatase [Oscillospiraceae bacterium]|nr:HAD family phosphatase [Oscillospiraceae bacterium]